jgi:hypothetical protein
VRRAAFDAVGLFDPALRSGGDAEWGARATAAGFRIGYRDEVRVLHPPRRTLRAVTRKAVRVTRGVEELAAARGDADPLARTLLDRLGRPVRELPLLRRAPRARFLPVLAVACTQAVLTTAETARMRLVLRRRAAGRT